VRRQKGMRKLGREHGVDVVECQDPKREKLKEYGAIGRCVDMSSKQC
jgi:hypothetical protein